MTQREMVREGVAGLLMILALGAVVALFFHPSDSYNSPVHAEIIPASGGGASATPTADGSKANTTLNNLGSVAINANLNTGAGTALNLAAVASAQGASSITGTNVTAAASNAVAGSSNAGAAAGGGFTFTAGDAARLTSGNANGGGYKFNLGAGIGTGVAGTFVLDTASVSPLTISGGTTWTIAAMNNLILSGESGLTKLTFDNSTGTAKFLTNGGVIADNGSAAVSPFLVQDNASAVFTIKDGGLPVYGGSTPAVSNTTANSCGTSAASLAGNESVGTITVGATAGTSCTITFATAETTRRNCHCEDETDATFSSYIRLSSTTGKCTGTFAAGALVTYICLTY